jgi:hypothetical protein
MNGVVVGDRYSTMNSDPFDLEPTEAAFVVLLKEHAELSHNVMMLIHDGILDEADYVTAIMQTDLAELGHVCQREACGYALASLRQTVVTSTRLPSCGARAAGRIGDAAGSGRSCRRCRMLSFLTDLADLLGKLIPG